MKNHFLLFYYSISAFYNSQVIFIYIFKVIKRNRENNAINVARINQRYAINDYDNEFN